MTSHLGRRRAPLVLIQRNHPSPKTFLLREGSLEFQRRTWNFCPNLNRSSRATADFFCPFKTRTHYRRWNNCSDFSWLQKKTRFQPANARCFTVSEQFRIISSNRHFPSKQGMATSGSSCIPLVSPHVKDLQSEFRHLVCQLFLFLGLPSCPSGALKWFLNYLNSPEWQCALRAHWRMEFLVYIHQTSPLSFF